MYNHAPLGYECPFCLLIAGTENENVYSKQADIIYQDKGLTAFISSHWWPNNPGHVIIIPNKHYENIFDMPDELLAEINVFSKKVALAFKDVYRCDGISIRQHNEHAGNQDVWHYHLHVFPRHEGDSLYQRHDEKRKTEPEERTEYAEKLREYFKFSKTV